MKTLDVVQGFLGSGKTTLINTLVRRVFPRDRILVVQTEWGEQELSDCGGRVRSISHDWETGFTAGVVKKWVRTPGIDRIIIEVNGMCPGHELFEVIDKLSKGERIRPGARLAVFHGPAWLSLRGEMAELFLNMALTSHGFLLREENKELVRWLSDTQPGASLTVGATPWGTWYRNSIRVRKRLRLRKGILCVFFAAAISLYAWLLFVKL